VYNPSFFDHFKICSDNKKHTIPINRDLTPDFGGDVIPVTFDYELEVSNILFNLLRCSFTATFDFVIYFVYILLKDSSLVINEQECTKILNEGKFKFTHEEMLQIREFLSTLALIEFESYKQHQNQSFKNECNLLQEGQYRIAFPENIEKITEERQWQLNEIKQSMEWT
jgi:hypothetical protein